MFGFVRGICWGLGWIIACWCMKCGEWSVEYDGSRLDLGERMRRLGGVV